MRTLSGAVVMNSGTHNKIINYIKGLTTKNIVWDTATQAEMEMRHVLQGTPYSVTFGDNGEITQVKAKIATGNGFLKTAFSIHDGRMFCKAEFA